MYPRHLLLAVFSLLVILTAISWVFEITAAGPSSEPPFIVFILNSIFIVTIGASVTFLALKSYSTTGYTNILVLGNAILLIAVASFLGGLGLFWNLPANTTVTMHNSLILIAGSLFLSGSFLTFERANLSDTANLKSKLLLGFLGVAGITFLIAFSAFNELLPDFFTVGAGSTTVRYWVLGSTVFLFVSSSALLAMVYRKSKSKLLYWYSGALAMFGLGFFIIIFVKYNSGALVWTGRVTQYVGSVFFLFAARESGSIGSNVNGFADAFSSDSRQVEVLLSRMSNGFAYHRILVDDIGKPVDFVFLIANDAFEQMTGLKIEDVIGKRATEVLPGIMKDPADWIGIYGKVALTRAPVTFEEYSESLKKWYSVSAYSPRKDYFATIFEDITRRKQVEENLRQSEERFHNVFERTALGIALGDFEGRVVESNLTLERMLGYSKEELKGKHFSEFTQSDDLNLERSLVEEVLAGKRDSYEIEKRYIRKSGEIIWVHLTGSLILGPNREPLISVATVEDVTRRRQAEEELRRINEELEERVRKRTEEVSAERQRLYNVLETLPAYVVLMDRDHRVPFANKVFRERFGQSYGRRCYEYLFNRDSPCENCESFKVLGNNEPVRWEWKGPDGRDYDIYDFPFVEADGSTLILEMGIDITKRKQAEAEVQAERKRFFDVLETLPPMICLLTQDYHVAFANRSFRDKFGESHGRHCYEYCYGRSKPCEFCESYSMFETGQPHHWEVKPPDGGVIDVYDFPFTDTDGSQMILEMELDITEQRRIETELKKHQEHLEYLVTERTKEVRETRDYLDNLLNFANAPIIVWNPQFHITRFNAAFERLTGHSAKDVLDKHLDMLFPEDKRDEAMAHIDRTLAGEYWETVEIPIKLKDGTVRTLLWNSANIYDARGKKVVATIAQGNDITERKRAEEKLREAERFAAIGRTAAMVGHDLRNPLQTIITLVALAQEHFEGIDDASVEKQQNLKLLRGITDQTFYMNKIVSDLQDYSVSIKPKPASVDLQQLISETISISRVPENVTVSTSIPQDVFTVNIDSAIVRRVLINLITNAVQAMPDGGKLNLKVYRKNKPPTLVVSLEDTGIGIPKTDRCKIFTPLFTTKAKGQGLGLSVCKRLVEACNGTISFESRVGKGSKFTIKLPLR